jgi:hypothetical protein
MAAGMAFFPEREPDKKYRPAREMIISRISKEENLMFLVIIFIEIIMN